jgi:hypothetical protein
LSPRRAPRTIVRTFEAADPMLLPAQVLPFLQHAYRDVRHFAVGYLGEAHDRGPATQDDLWASLDFNLFVSPPHMPDWISKDRSWYLRWLHRFVPTDRSTDRLFHELVIERDGRIRKDLLLAASELSVEAKLRLLADPGVTDNLAVDEVLGLRDDVWLAGQSFEQLWLALEEHAAGLGAYGTIESLPFRRAVRVVRALAAYPERAGERALASLPGPAPEDDAASWMEAFAVLIFGRVPMPALAAGLLDILGVDVDLYLNERASDALVRLGTPEVVEAIEQRLPGSTRPFSTYGAGVLSEIKIPESEAACLRLLERSADVRTRTQYASCLYHLCASTPEAFAAIAAMVLTGRYDPELLSLDDDLITLGKMVGWAPDEAAWEARPIPARGEGRRKLLARLEALRKRHPGQLPPLRPDRTAPYGAMPRRKASR